MILLVDNYDSFSYNLYQLAGEINPDIKVIRNDEFTVKQIRELKPERIILSPGPGRPESAGIIMEIVKVLDNMKLAAIRRECEKAAFKERKLSYDGGKIFLLYHPDYEVAMSKERYIGAWRSVNDIQAQAGPDRFKLILNKIEEIIEPYSQIVVPYKSRAWTVQSV